MDTPHTNTQASMAEVAPEKGAEIFTYSSSATLYAMNWSVRQDKDFRLALGSFKENAANFLELIELDEESGSFRCPPGFKADHGYPATKVMFIPDKEGNMADLLASSGESLRVWTVDDSGIRLERALDPKPGEPCEPLTSFDWNESNPSLLGTCSTDQTCTIWHIESGKIVERFVAHDKEVYDIAWGGGEGGTFATVSADGSVRVFDLRNIDSSTIIYESPSPETPLVRLSWNKQDPRFLAAVLKVRMRIMGCSVGNEWMLTNGFFAFCMLMY